MATSPVTPTAASGIDIQSFLNILTQQLTHQDPMKPMDNQEFIAQMAQFAQLQQTQEQSQKLDQLLYVEASNQSIGMLGKQVRYNTASGGGDAGRVTALSFESGSPKLTITKSNGLADIGVALNQIVEVKNP